MNRYKADLVRLMSFKDGISYGSDHTFTTEALLQITPSDVCRWMNKRAYGDSDPTDDMKPVHARSSTLEFAKKAVSSFMPRVNTSWDPVTEQGNPTRSDAVNKLIKRVKRSEVRREGVGSNARRAIEFDEFLSLLTLLELKKSVLRQIRWSKNISEERDAPEQIVFGSMDSRLCPLLNLAIHIETSPNKPAFEKLKEGKLGTHSLRKGAATLLLNDVAPTVKAMMGESIAKTLALPLLWAALESTDNISDLLPFSGGGGEGVRREFAALHSQLLTSRRYMTELMNEVLHSRRESQREMEKIFISV
eukprot:jgi/Phyca11/9792/fgenesh1_pm.PHYCAscaffold_41_\